MPATKRCGHCKRHKPIADFYRVKAKGGALHCWCKQCVCERTNARKAEKKSQILAEAKAYREANPDRIREAKKKCYAAKIDVYREKSRQNRLKDPAKMRERARQWKLNNRERVYDAIHRRRARKLGNGPVDRIDRVIVHSRDHGRCWLCREPVKQTDMHLDHVVPLSKGGTHTYDNVRTSCAACNLRKGARMPAEVKNA